MKIEQRFKYYQSKMNEDFPDDIYETIESSATFNHKSFSDQIKHNLDFYGMTVDSLAKSCNISSFRMSCLISGNATFEKREVDLVKRRLHI